MSEIKRDNHYISHFYLAGFTPSGTKDDFLFVHDLHQRKSWRTKPAKAGFRKDYYQLQTAGLHPNELENGIDEHIESPAAFVIREIAATNRLPDKNSPEFRTLLAFIAFLGLGVPKVRESIAIEDESSIKNSLKEASESGPDKLAEAVRRLRMDGVELPQMMNASIAQEPDGYSIHLPQKWHITNFLMMLTNIFKHSHLLTERNWSLLMADPDAGHFICSDVPVSCMPLATDKYHHPSRYERPDFGLDTLIIMPLTKSLAIEGSTQALSASRYLDRLQVGLLNNFLIRSIFSEEQSLRFIYSPFEDFTFENNDTLWHQADIMSGRFQNEWSQKFSDYLQQINSQM